MRYLRSLLLVCGVFAASSALAEMKLKVADASSSGTYKQMLAQIIGVCGTDGGLVIEEADTKGGATENLEALVNNQVNAAFLHSDVIFYNSQANPDYHNYKALLALYPEEIHILTLRNSKTKSGGVYGVGGKIVEFNSLADLANYNVGAAGGGVITAKILTGQGEARFHPVAYDGRDEVMAALSSGEVQAAIFVGGAPLPNIEKLNWKEYKLIPIGEAIANRLSGVYRPAMINYAQLKSGNVKTLAPMATLLTRQYKTEKMVAALAEFRQCFYKNLDELRETTGSHPKWQVVKEDDHGVWDWYDLPTSTTHAPARTVAPTPVQKEEPVTDEEPAPKPAPVKKSKNRKH